MLSSIHSNKLLACLKVAFPDLLAIYTLVFLRKAALDSSDHAFSSIQASSKTRALESVGVRTVPFLEILLLICPSSASSRAFRPPDRATLVAPTLLHTSAVGL